MCSSSAISERNRPSRPVLQGSHVRYGSRQSRDPQVRFDLGFWPKGPERPRLAALAAKRRGSGHNGQMCPLCARYPRHHDGTGRNGPFLPWSGHLSTFTREPPSGGDRMAARPGPSGGRPSYRGWEPRFGRQGRPNSAVLARRPERGRCVPAVPNTRTERARCARSSLSSGFASGGGGPGGTPPGREVIRPYGPDGRLLWEELAPSGAGDGYVEGGRARKAGPDGY